MTDDDSYAILDEIHVKESLGLEDHPNRTVPRRVLTELCRELGHRPEHIASINIYPDRVSVTYDHLVAEEPGDA